MVAEPTSAVSIAPIRVLLVTRDEGSHHLIRDLLDAAPHVRFTLDRVRRLSAGTVRLGTGEVDVCLLDAGQSEPDCLDLLRHVEGRGIAVPIVMLSNGGSLELDLQAMALGVADFVDRARLDPAVLERTIRHALARQRQAERLARLAQYDALTGLANRSLFQDRLERALAWARRRERQVAVMILDLNGFKAVNDRLGHAAGDRLLTIMAKRLGRRLRETDTVARLGGDEFGLVIENLARPAHAALVARKILDAIAPPATVDGEEVTVTASLGVAIYPKDGVDVDTLGRLADRAMYRAKAEGGNLCRFASDQMERRVQRGAILEADLKRGLEQGELLLHFQPQVTLTPGVLGVAALVRWAHPELGPIGPERFLPLAEDSGLLEPVTEWLLDAACRQAARWRERGLERVQVAVPIWSRQQLAWTGLVGELDDRLRRLGLAPAKIEIELAEELLLADGEVGGSTVAALKELDVRLALDGYGRGPTSLKVLRMGPLDTVKLARELLQGVPDETRPSALLEAIVTLARELGLRVVAEGAERQAQLAFLRRAGCAAVQAFMSCPPLPAAACTSWLYEAVGRRPWPPAGIAAGGGDGKMPSAAAAPEPQIPGLAIAGPLTNERGGAAARSVALPLVALPSR